MLDVKGQLISGFPAFPVYPGAKLIESSKVKNSPDPTKGYQAEWEAQAESVAKVMDWYLKELKSTGWEILTLDDPKGYGEQVANVSKDGNVVNLRVELSEPGMIEIKVDIPVTS